MLRTVRVMWPGPQAGAGGPAQGTVPESANHCTGYGTHTGAGQARHLYAVLTETKLLRSHRFG